MKRGFSLVELSIVLVILGLLVGGVLAGQSLVRGAQLRAMISEEQRFVAAEQSFHDKYRAVAGDFNNAVAYWGLSTGCSGTVVNGTCNGNGDGLVANSGGAGATAEQLQFWNQLALAGLIEGSYTGIAGAVGVLDSTAGKNIPASRWTNAGWNINYNANSAGDPTFYAFDYQHYFIDGTYSSGGPSTNATMTPADAWNIDGKTDDGLPGTGSVIAVGWSTCTTSATKTDYTGTYKLTDSGIDCALAFVQAF
jgi:prepilin-type N-terminal cleavage/methylation domain-containing protein